MEILAYSANDQISSLLNQKSNFYVLSVRGMNISIAKNMYYLAKFCNYDYGNAL